MPEGMANDFKKMILSSNTKFYGGDKINNDEKESFF
jgi:hypothetical protein